jgi:ubiquitin-like 1-activating enzyme E1 B
MDTNLCKESYLAIAKTEPPIFNKMRQWIMVCSMVLYLEDRTDARLANEIAELRKEAFDMRELREALGTDEGYRKVFRKVFGKDIERLKGMKDMWKTRQEPQLLDFDALDQKLSSIDPAISTKDQQAWTTEESLAVFRDR